MLQMEGEVRAVQSHLIMTERVGEWLTEIGADNVLVAELGTEGCSSQQPVEVTVEVDAEDIRAVVVKRNLLLRASDQLKAVM